MTDRLTLDEAVALAGRAVHRVDREGMHGASMITDRQIEAMAILLAALGCPPIPPDATAEELELPLALFLQRFHSNGGQR